MFKNIKEFFKMFTPDCIKELCALLGIFTCFEAFLVITRYLPLMQA